MSIENEANEVTKTSYASCTATSVPIGMQQVDTLLCGIRKAGTDIVNLRNRQGLAVLKVAPQDACGTIVEIPLDDKAIAVLDAELGRQLCATSKQMHTELACLGKAKKEEPEEEEEAEDEKPAKRTPRKKKPSPLVCPEHLGTFGEDYTMYTACDTCGLKLQCGDAADE